MPTKLTVFANEDLGLFSGLFLALRRQRNVRAAGLAPPIGRVKQSTHKAMKHHEHDDCWDQSEDK